MRLKIFMLVLFIIIFLIMNNIFTDSYIVYLFTRDEDKKLSVVKISNFRPYFYVLDEKGCYVSIFGDRCRKIVVESPYDVAILREKYSQTFEADVHYPNRFLIDYYDDIIDEVPLRKQWIDLEMCTDSLMLPDVNNPSDPIISICVYDSFLDKYVVFAWHKKYKDVTYNSSYNFDVVLCPSEDVMLDLFLRFEKENFPDIMMGWNATLFDFPYLFNRYGAERFRKISPIYKSGIWKNGAYNNYYIAGCSLMDYLNMYKHVTLSSGSRESYSLDYIGKYELGLPKKELPGVINRKLWDDYLDKIIQYNKRDVEIMVKIDEKLSIVNYFNTIRRIARCRFDDVFLNSVVVDCYLLGLVRNRYVLPTKKKHDKSDYEGAFTKNPEVGVHNWVAVFDAASLYPSILITFNISPETVDKNGDIDIDGIKFRSNPVGLYPEACIKMINFRKILKEKMKKYEINSDEYNRLKLYEQSVKFLTNSIYGYSAYSGSRLYSIDVARAVTYVGREYTKWVGATVQGLGYRFIYGDTDSVYVNLKNTNLNDCINEGKYIQKFVNDRSNEFVRRFGAKESYLNLKFEGIYEKIFFITKKKYVGFKVWNDEQVCNIFETKGVEARRSDVPEIGRQFLKDLYMMILSGATKEKVDEFVMDFVEKIKKLDPSELGFPCGVKNIDTYKNVPIHVRALLYSMKYKFDVFRAGEKIKYIFVRSVPEGYEKTDVIAFKDKIPENFEIDYDRIIDRLVWMKVNPLYQALGWKHIDKKNVVYESLF